MNLLDAEYVMIDMGERRHITVIVKTVCEDDIPFTIRSARWELLSYGEVEAEGECTINGHELDVYIEPQNKGMYQLRFIYEVANEIWVDVLELRVK